MSGMSTVGISTACFYPEDTYQAFCRVSRLGAPVAEVFMNSVEELSSASLKRFRIRAEESGTRIISLHPYTSAFESLLFFSEYRARLADGLEVYKRFFNGAAELGADYLVFHGEKCTPTFSRSLSCDEFICESYGRLIELGKSFGVMFTQENVNNHRSQTADFIKKLNTLVPNLHYTFDLKQAYRAKQPYEDILDAMRGKLVHVHMNDFGEHECCLPFTGLVDMTRFCEKLDEIGYQNNAVIEVYRSSFEKETELADAMHKTQAVFCADPS